MKLPIRRDSGAPLAGRELYRPNTDRPTVDDEAIGIRKPILFGVALIAVFFGGFGTWAALAPLDSAAIAPGTVVVGGSRKAIQHLEGGIVSEVKVEEGSEVEAGDPLIVLDETQPGSSLAMVRGRLRTALALEARLAAERDDKDRIEFPEWMVAEAAENPTVAEVMTSQNRIFTSRRESVLSQKSILQQRIEQYNEEIRGLQGEIASQSNQLSLIQDELNDVRFLYEKGLARRPRLLALEREASNIQGARARNVAAIARAKQAIGEAQMRMADLDTNLRREVVEQLREVQSEIADLWEKNRSAEDIMTRTVLRAPVSGVVVGLNVFTQGAVIRPGETLMEIVPRDDALIVEARVDPNDIDVVHAGLGAQVRLTAFSQRISPILNGTVETVSADRRVDERTGIPYYTARVRLDHQDEAGAADFELYPGMPAEVMIVTGERTALSYLVRPLIYSFNRALRES